MSGVVLTRGSRFRVTRGTAPLLSWWAWRLRGWRDRLLGRDVAFAEGRDCALANAAMVAYDMGRPDIRMAINRLIPMDSKMKPLDSRDDAYGV